MQFFRVVGVSLLCLTGFATPLRAIEYSYYTTLLRSPHATIAHITATCILGTLLFITYNQLKSLKNNAITKAMAKEYVKHSYLDENLKEQVITAATSQSQGALGAHFATQGQMLGVSTQMADYQREHNILEQKVQLLEQENNNYKEQLQSFAQRLTTLEKSEKTT